MDKNLIQFPTQTDQDPIEVAIDAEVEKLLEKYGTQETIKALGRLFEKADRENQDALDDQE